MMGLLSRYAGCRPVARRGWRRATGATRLRRELPRVAARPGQHLVGLRVIELMRDGVPLQLLAGPQRDHADVADDHRAAADRGVADRRLAALDAIDEVLHLVGRPAVVHLRVVLERLRRGSSRRWRGSCRG